jgi:ABC-type thiamine transport system ATPase subunit
MGWKTDHTAEEFAMPHVATTVHCDIHESFRVRQVAGMFDLPADETSRETFTVEIPSLEEDWRIGAIVGPSGSGKSTIAKAVFGDAVCGRQDWRRDQAVVDEFGDRPIKEITQTLTAVGFASPPAWVKPYHALSTGQQFRCDLARTLLADVPLVVFDEFTSVVDRTVAKVGSAAVSRCIRSGRIQRRFIAVTCHYDVVDWLEPDWVVDMANGKLKRGRLRRPRIELQLARCRPAAWRLFARHHYLSGSLSPFARCYLATWGDEPVAFCATLHLYGFRGRRRVTRIVTLPDYQGIGIGARVLDAVARHESADRQRVSITSSHPAIIGYCRKSPAWRAVQVSRAGNRKHYRKHDKLVRTSQGRAVVSFEYATDARATTVARSVSE